MIKFKKKGTSLKYTRNELYYIENEKYALTQGEELIGAYEKGHKTLLITNKKFLFISSKGNNKDYTAIPYTKMQLFSVSKYLTKVVVYFSINYMQRMSITLQYAVNDADAITQAYTYQNSVDCTVEKDLNVPQMIKPVKPKKEPKVKKEKEEVVEEEKQEEVSNEEAVENKEVSDECPAEYLEDADE